MFGWMRRKPKAREFTVYFLRAEQQDSATRDRLEDGFREWLGVNAPSYFLMPLQGSHEPLGPLYIGFLKTAEETAYKLYWHRPRNIWLQDCFKVTLEVSDV
jgi:hypothetical protein